MNKLINNKIINWWKTWLVDNELMKKLIGWWWIDELMSWWKMNWWIDELVNWWKMNWWIDEKWIDEKKKVIWWTDVKWKKKGIDELINKYKLKRIVLLYYNIIYYLIPNAIYSFSRK
jgi:hypothetical protein